MSFTQKLINIAITLAPNPGTNQPNTFQESGTNNVTLSGHRTSVKIVNSGAAAGSKAQVLIYGLTLSLMNQLSTLGMVVKLVPRNQIVVTAGDASGMSTVFQGVILQAYGDFNQAPNVPFHFECNSTTALAVIPAKATSYQGGAAVSDIMSSLAQQMGLSFENNGVTTQMTSPYYAGSAMSQVRRLARDAGISAEVIDSTLCIWPFPGNRSGAVPVVSPADGSMKGYPGFTQQGIVFDALYNPQIRFGGQVQVQGSILTAANGTWNVFKLDHDLESMVPRGNWKSTVYGYNPKFPQPIPPGL